MTYLITYARQGTPPRVVNDFDSDEATAKDFCTGLIDSGMVRVALHTLADDGLIAPVALWTRGSNGQAVRKRNIAAPERPQETTVAEAPEGEDEGILADAEAAQEYLDAAQEDEAHTYEGYCVKCRQTRAFHGEVSETKNGRLMAKGKCPVCGTGVNRILKNVEHADDWHEEESAAPEPEAEETVEPEPEPEPAPEPVVHELVREATNRGTHLSCSAGDWDKWVTRKTEKAGRTQFEAHAEEMAEAEEEESDDDGEAADYDRAHPDSVGLAVEFAIAEAVPEGTPVEEIAEAAAHVVEELTEVTDAHEEIPEELRDKEAAATTPKPRKRQARKQSAKAKEKEDAEAAAIRNMKVAECRYCHKKIPVQEKAGLRIFLTHPDADKGLDRCPGSLVTLD